MGVENLEKFQCFSVSVLAITNGVLNLSTEETWALKLAATPESMSLIFLYNSASHSHCVRGWDEISADHSEIQKDNKWNLFQEVAAGSSGFLPNNSLKTHLSLFRLPSFQCDCFSCHLHPRDVMHAVSVSLWCQSSRFAARMVVGAQRAEDTQQLDIIWGVDVLQFRTSAHIRCCLPLPGSVCCSRSNCDVIISGETTRKQQTHPLVHYSILRYLSCRCGRIV